MCPGEGLRKWVRVDRPFLPGGGTRMRPWHVETVRHRLPEFPNLVIEHDHAVGRARGFRGHLEN